MMPIDDKGSALLQIKERYDVNKAFKKVATAGR